jgi:hypothetical protein
MQGVRTRTMKLRQSQDDPVSVAVFTSAAVPEGLGFCKLCPVNVASQFERLIENHTLTRRSRSRSLKRGLESSRVVDFRDLSNIVPWYRSAVRDTG